MAASLGIAPCELHFWPSQRSQTSDYSGVGGVVGAALSGPRADTPEGLSANLPAAAQSEALGRINLSALLGMPDVRLIIEEAPVDKKAAGSRKGPRLSSSTAPCYAELIVDLIGYRSHITAGRDFGARFNLRRYDGAEITISRGAKDVPVEIYPAKTPEDEPAAREELKAAFATVTEHFLASRKR